MKRPQFLDTGILFKRHIEILQKNCRTVSILIIMKAGDDERISTVKMLNEVDTGAA